VWKRSSQAAAVILVTVLCAALGAAGTEELSRELRSIRFVSDAPIDEAGLLRLLPFEVGDRIGEADLARARQLLEEKGIFRIVDLFLVPEGTRPRQATQLSPLATADRGGSGGVSLVIELQRKRIINAVRIRGYHHISRREASRLVRLTAGTIFEPELIDAAARRIETRYADLGFVGTRVEVTPTLRPGEIDLDFEIHEGSPLLVAAVVVAGETGLPGDRLERELAKKYEGKRHARGQLREAERAMLALLRRGGYYEARVSVSWEPSSDHHGVLWFDVDAGAEYRVEMSGNEHKRESKLLKLIDLEKRLIITDGTWRELARRMVHAYQEAGYAQARVGVSIVEGSPRIVRFKVTEGERYVVRQVLFQGNDTISESLLRAVVLTQPPRCFLWNWLPGLHTGVLVSDTVDGDVERIVMLYQEKGFASADVYDLVRWFDDENHEVSVLFLIEEGPQTIVTEVRREGLEALGKAAAPYELSVGQPLDMEAIARDRLELLRAFQRKGFSEAQVETSVERQAESERVEARVSLIARPGTQRKIGAVVVQDNIDTRDRVILRELPFEEGEPLNTEALLKGQANVYRLGLFRTVSVRPLDAESSTTPDVGVRVSERAPGRFEWGVGYNTRDGFGGFLEAGYDNLGGMARRINLRGAVALEPGDWAPSQYLGTLGYAEPRVLGSPWTFRSSLSGERSTRSVDEFSIERVSLVSSVDRPIVARLRSGFEVEVDRSDVFDVAPDAVLTPEDEGVTHTVAVSPFLVYEGRDDPFAPREGVFESARIRYALGGLSTVHFAKLSVQHSQYIPLVDDLILAYVLRGGWARPFDDNFTVPIRERFFLGGQTTVRGFSENSVGPHGKDGNPQGGDLSLNANVELDFPLLYGFGGAVFCDGGGVYLQERSISIHDFRRSAGVGLRYLTPIGPLNLDYGIKLDRRDGEDFGAVHFSIGARF